jgi:VCBS repeat-containing protein
LNYAGKSGSDASDSHSGSQFNFDSLSHPVHGDTVAIPDAHLLFSGNYQRSGADLIVSDHDHRVVVPDYFHGDKRPTLVSPEGAQLDPDIIEALTGHVQYAQAAGTGSAGKVVGHLVKMTGSASIVRGGVTIDLNNGDAVYQNDVVQTGSGSTLGLVMIDGTTFNVTANARLMLNDLTYDANSTSNTSLFTLVQGAASFVAGQVAKTGDMKVGTPVATMGIRGTAVILDISSVDGRVSVSVVDQQDGQTHSVQVYNTRGVLIGTVTSSGSGLTLTPLANFEVIAQASNKTPAQIAQEFNAFQSLLQTYDAGKALFPNLPQHTDANPNATKYAFGSTPLTSPGTEFHSPERGAPGGENPSGTGTPIKFTTTSSPSVTGFLNSDPIFLPQTAGPVTATGSLVEDSDATAASGTVQDVNSGGAFRAVSAAALVGTYGNFTFNESTGAWTYELVHSQADSLTAGQVVHDTLTVTAADGTTRVIDVTITGTNDAPTISGDTTGTVFEDDHSTASGQTIANDSGTLTVQDVDSGESYFQPVNPNALSGTYGDFTFNHSTGEWTYKLVDDRVNGLAACEIKHDTLTVMTADGTTQVIDVTVTGTNDAPVFDACDVPVTYEAGGDAVALVDNVSVSDIDSADYNGGSLTARVSCGGHDGDILSIENSEYISVACDGTIMFDSDGVAGPAGWVEIGTLRDSIDLTIDLNGHATNEAIARLTEAIRFQTEPNPQAGARTVEFALTDGDGTAHNGNDTGFLYATVNVAASNHAPVANDDTLAPAGDGWTFNSANGHFYRLVSTAMSWDDANAAAQSDGAYLATITSQAEQGFVGPLAAGHRSWLGGMSTDDLYGNGHFFWVTGPEAGAAFTYTHWVPGEPNGGFSSATQYVHIEGVSDPLGLGWNDAPGVDNGRDFIEEWGGRPSDANVGEDSTLTIATCTLLANDTDADPSDYPTIVSVSATGAEGVLVTVSGTNISYDPTHAAALQALKAGETTTDTFTYTIDDGHGGTDTATVTLVVAGINDAPDFTGDNLAATLAPGDCAVAIVSAVSATDVDSDSYVGGSLTATVTKGCNEGDRLSIAESEYIHVSASGHIVSFDSDGCGGPADFVEIGTLTDNCNSLTIGLNENASDAAIARLTQAIRFESTNPDPDAGTRTVTFTLKDGDGTANGGHDSESFTVTVDVAALPDNHAPVIVTDNLQLDECGGTTTVSGLSVSDEDATTTETFNVMTSSFGSRTVTPSTYSGSLAHINATLDNGVTYNPGSTPPSTNKVTVTVTDSFGAADSVNFIFNEAGTGPNITLQGTSGKDVIFATGHTDTLTGGASADQFVFRADSGCDTITDFTPGQDKIDLFDELPFDRGHTGSFNAWINNNCAVEQLASGTLIHLDGDNSILLSNVTKASLAMNDFILHPAGQ